LHFHPLKIFGAFAACHEEMAQLLVSRLLASEPVIAGLAEKTHDENNDLRSLSVMILGAGGPKEAKKLQKAQRYEFSLFQLERKVRVVINHNYFCAPFRTCGVQTLRIFTPPSQPEPTP